MELPVANIYQNAALPRVEAYTAFLIQNHLNDYTDEYMRLFARHGIDVNTYFPPDESRTLQEQFRNAAFDHLILLAEGRWYEQIGQTLKQMLPPGNDSADQLKAKTARLFVLSFIRKQAYKKFISKYTADVAEAIALIEEVDHYSLVFEKSINDTYLRNMGALLDVREQLYKEAQRMAHIGNWAFDIGAGNVKYSEEASRICGFDELAGELTLQHIRALLQPDDWDELWKKYFRLKRTGKPFFYIATIRLPNGSERIVELKAQPARDAGSTRHIVGTIQDVSIEQGLIRSLQETSHLYRQTEAMANIGCWSQDINTGKVTFSTGLFQIYELPPHSGDVDMETVRSYVCAGDRQRLDRLAVRCREEGARYELQYWVELPAGKRKLLHCIGEAVYDPNGLRYAIIGTVRDMTGEHQMILRLREKELLYRQAQTIARIGNWVNDFATCKTSWSEELYHIFKVDPADPEARRDAANRLPPADRAILMAHMKRCRENGTPFDCKYQVLMPADGSIRHFRSKGERVLDDQGVPVRMIGTVQDISEQVLVENRLREQQRFIQKITDIAPIMITVYGLELRNYVFVSLGIEKLLGYTREHALANGLDLIIGHIHPDDRARVVGEWEEAISQANSGGADTITEFKYRILHQDGSYRWFHTLCGVFQRDKEGKASQMIHLCIDITGEKQAEQVLSQKNVLLQQSNSSLEEFAYIASHDLQEPLRKISTFGNMLQTLQEENLSDSGKLYLRKIVDSSIRMQAMINDLLQVSIISGNRSFKEDHLQELLEEVLVTLEYKIEQTGATIAQVRPLPRLKVIASQMRQLFQNLISNSLKFARKEVRPVITITHRYLDGHEPELQSLPPDRRYLSVTFSDNGIGFSNDYAVKIFAIFQRLHGKAEYEGTGIGLAVCRKIAEHHDGAIFASGELGRGASFQIILPV